MFQFSGFALLSEWHVFNMPGCPIQVSADQSVVCTSPQLFAAYHAFHRLWEPRHPPYALILLIVLFIGYKLHGLQLRVNPEPYTLSLAPNIVFFLLFKYFLIPICQWTFRPLAPKKGTKLNPSPFGGRGALWRITESNRWPPACKAGALASWANPPSCWLTVAG